MTPVEPPRPLVELPGKDDVPPEVRAVFESGEAQYGKVLETWRALALRPEIFVAYLPYLRAIVGPGTLDQRLKELVEVETALLNHCRYSVSHRVRSARAAGVSEEELVALARGEWAGFTEQERAALEFARELTLRPPERTFGEDERAVSGELLARLKDSFTDPQLVELTVTVAIWNALARFHRVMAFELDMDPPPAEIDALV